MSDLDPVTVQVIGASAAGIVREMQEALFRTGYSTIIRESQDASCAILLPDGTLAAQHVVLPLHIGAFPACLAGVLRRYAREEMAEGDTFVVNHPYEGGSAHAPDFAVITPAFGEGRLLGFTASIAHKSDIGGPVPGSCSGQAREIFNEGLHIPPLRLVRAGEVNREVEAIIRANSRTPDLVMGDVRGQIGCARVGAARLAEMARKHGAQTVETALKRLQQAGRERLQATLAAWPDGMAMAERRLEGDGVRKDHPIRIAVRVEKFGQRIVFDFTSCDDQAQGPANIRPPLVRAACAYVLIALSDPAQPINGGLLDAFEVRTRPGSILDPHFPAPVNTYNGTVHAVINAAFEALSGIVPGLQRADGSDSRSLLFGLSASRPDPRARAYVQYEIFAGGTGARTGLDGVNGCHVNQTNGRIAPIEVIETEFPVCLRRFELIPDSGGAGEFRGGLAFRRDYEVLAEEMRLSIRSGKHVMPPQGFAGGQAGRCGDARIDPDTQDERLLAARQADVPLVRGEVVRLDTPGGGGLGDPRARLPEAVRADVLDGYVSQAQAETVYGVRFISGDPKVGVDRQGTEAARSGAARGPVAAE
jgi:N-methylhydantoinase B